MPRFARHPYVDNGRPALQDARTFVIEKSDYSGNLKYLLALS